MTKLYPFFVFLFFMSSTLSFGGGMINGQTAIIPQKILTLKMIAEKEIELMLLIQKQKIQLEERKKVTIERLRILTGIEMLATKIVYEKMESDKKLEKIKKMLLLELNLENMENFDK